MKPEFKPATPEEREDARRRREYADFVLGKSSSRHRERQFERIVRDRQIERPASSTDHNRAEEAQRNMDFSEALIHLKTGAKLGRSGWNGPGQFVCMMERLQLPPYNTQDTARKVNDRTARFIGPDAPLDSQPYLALYNAQGKWQPGWVPSQGDLFATDWEVVPQHSLVPPAETPQSDPSFEPDPITEPDVAVPTAPAMGTDTPAAPDIEAEPLTTSESADADSSGGEKCSPPPWMPA